MTCKRTVIPGGEVWTCSRGVDKPACRFCGGRSSVSCGYKLRGKKSGQTCSIPMCLGCHCTVGGSDLVLCPTHARVTTKELLAEKVIE